MDSNNQNEEDKELDLKRLSKKVGFIIVVLWLISLMALNNPWVKHGNNIGDSFGAVNALFSGLALAGIIITILMQRDELKLQRQELKFTREEMEKTRDEFVIQNSTLKTQKFENTFFQMLNLFNSIIDSIEINIGSDHLKGRRALDRLFKIYVEKLEAFCNTEEFINTHEILDGREITYNLNEEESMIVYDEFYIEYNDLLTHYFRTFYHVIKLIDTTDGIDKDQYISIARAQLSSSEQMLLFYNCLSRLGRTKFKPLVEKYAFFNNIDYHRFPTLHLDQSFGPTAYGFPPTSEA